MAKKLNTAAILEAGSPHALSDTELRERISTMRKTARDRARRLEQQGLGRFSAAYRATNAAAGFGVTRSGTGRAEMEREYKRLYNFLTSDTSTAGGIKKSWRQVTGYKWGGEKTQGSGKGATSNKKWEAFLYLTGTYSDVAPMSPYDPIYQELWQAAPDDVDSALDNVIMELEGRRAEMEEALDGDFWDMEEDEDEW